MSRISAPISLIRLRLRGARPESRRPIRWRQRNWFRRV